jgi:hypothetical protein
MRISSNLVELIVFAGLLREEVEEGGSVVQQLQTKA